MGFYCAGVRARSKEIDDIHTWGEGEAPSKIAANAAGTDDANPIVCLRCLHWIFVCTSVTHDMLLLEQRDDVQGANKVVSRKKRQKERNPQYQYEKMTSSLQMQMHADGYDPGASSHGFRHYGTTYYITMLLGFRHVPCTSL